MNNCSLEALRGYTYMHNYMHTCKHGCVPESLSRHNRDLRGTEEVGVYGVRVVVDWIVFIFLFFSSVPSMHLLARLRDERRHLYLDRKMKM